jgi:orotidine-5'-phosphate decarboxylase
MDRSQLLADLRARPSRARVITALDVPDAARAVALARSLGPDGRLVKVGLELFSAAGPAVIESLRAEGREVFLDLKWHDIPQTIAGAARVAARLGATFVTVHAAAGRRGLAAAAEALASASGGGAPRPALLAVTVLTSLAPEELDELAPSSEPLTARVVRLARLAWDCGCDGVVCAAPDLPRLRAALGATPLAVTPGIRPATAGGDDQRRVATPAAAVADGADFLVVGRPITGAADPAAALRAIVAELPER